jgi:hypothetical protein
MTLPSFDRRRLPTAGGEPPRRWAAARLRRGLAFEELERRWVLNAAGAGVLHPTLVLHRNSDGSVPFQTSAPVGLTPTQLRHAYGFDQITIGSVTGNGAGQTIAIIDAYDSPTVASDLHAFDVAFGIPDPPSLRRVAQDGSTNYPGTDPAGAGNPNGTWEMETALDVEWAHAMAPGANILLVEASDASNANLMTAAVSYARSQPGVSVISMSFGQNDFFGETSFDSLFTTPSGHTGITFLAATGDNGQPSGYPAYSPNVVAVGGTTLNVDSAGNIISETGWSGSGGGVSTIEPQPAYQNPITSAFSTTNRANPDVAYNADPNTGVPVDDSWDFGASTPWEQFGGTSLATPSWGALIAIADQGRVAAGLTPLDGPSQTLPKLYSIPASDFNDITSGNNGFAAGPGYDLVTGRGSPKAALVVKDLVGAYAVSSSTPANGATVSTPPTDFSLTLAAPYTPSSVQASDLAVNGITANSFTLTSSTTITFHYTTSPVTTQGLQSMSIAAGAITRQTDGAPLAAFSGSFRYDVLVIAVTNTTPDNGSTVTLPLSSVTVHFNEAFASSSISTSNLSLSQGFVSSFSLVDSQTVTYNLTGISNGGTLTINMAAGAVTDAFGNPSAAFSGSLVLVKPPVPFPTPFASVSPAGSLVYQNSTSGTITAGSGDTYTLSLAAGQTLTVLVTPANSLQAQVTVTGPGLSHASSSASPGAPAVLETLAISSAGTYSIVVSGLAGTTGNYTIQAFLNAAISSSVIGGVSNHTIATAQGLDSSFTTLSGSSQRAAILGSITSSIGPDGFGYGGVAIAPQFDDISPTGSSPTPNPPVLVGVDDGYVHLRSTNLSGFQFSFYGTTYTSIYVSSNGLLTFGGGNADYQNTDLTTSPFQAAIAPFWADLVVIGQANSGVYWQVQGNGASQRLVIQWNDCSFYNGNFTGQVTVEAILNANGTMIFNYENLNSGDIGAGGATATVGIKNTGTQGSNRLLVSFDSATSPYVGTGKSIEIGIGVGGTATDVYAFSLAAGQTTTLAAVGQKSATVSVALENAQGATLASGTSPGSGASVNSIIDNFVAPSAGTYYAVVTGTTGSAYTLVVTRDADFGDQANGSFSTAENLGSSNGALGAILAAGTTENWYSVNVPAGDAILLETTTPGSSNGQFVDNLAPSIQLYSPSDVLLASGQGAGNQSLSTVVNTAGLYRIRVFGANSTSGEYFLSAAIDETPPTASIVPVNPNPRTAPVSQIQIVFNEPVSGLSLGNFSLTSGGGPNLLTSSQTLTTSDNITYTLGNLAPVTGTIGTYSLGLSASATVTDSAGGYLASGSSVTFVVNVPVSVTNNSDSGPGSLRQALLDLAGAPGLTHSIQFKLPAGSQTINLVSALPGVTDPLIALLDSTQNVTINSSGLAPWSNNSSLTLSGPGTLTVVGGIAGSGNSTVAAGTTLVTSQIIQGSLVIGGTAGNPARVTVAASVSLGNPLATSAVAATNSPASPSSLGVSSANSSYPDGPVSTASLATSSVANSLNEPNPATASLRSDPSSTSAIKSNSPHSAGGVPGQLSIPTSAISGFAASSREAGSPIVAGPSGLVSNPVTAGGFAAPMASVPQLNLEALAVLFDEANAFEWAATSRASPDSLADTALFSLANDLITLLSHQP